MFDFIGKFRKRVDRAGINLPALERRAGTAERIDGRTVYANGCLVETESLTWDLLRDEQEDAIREYGADEVRHRSLITYTDWIEVKAEIEEMAAKRRAFPPKTPWELDRKFREAFPSAPQPMPKRNQPTGDCVGNGTERSAAAMLLDLWSQGFNFMPRPIHPSYSYTIARMLAGMTRGAGANVSLAGKGLYQHGFLFEDQPNVPRYSADRRVSDRWGQGGWNSDEFKQMLELATPFKARVIRLPKRNNIDAINTSFDAGLKINGGFGSAPVGTYTKQGVKFSNKTKKANHCMSQLGRFLDPVPGYCWGQSWGSFYPGECVLGTPDWATNLEPDLFEWFMDGSDCYVIQFVIGTSTGKPNWGLMP